MNFVCRCRLRLKSALLCCGGREKRGVGLAPGPVLGQPMLTWCLLLCCPVNFSRVSLCSCVELCGVICLANDELLIGAAAFTFQKAPRPSCIRQEKAWACYCKIKPLKCFVSHHQYNLPKRFLQGCLQVAGALNESSNWTLLMTFLKFVDSSWVFIVLEYSALLISADSQE